MVKYIKLIREKCISISVLIITILSHKLYQHSKVLYIYVELFYCYYTHLRGIKRKCGWPLEYKGMFGNCFFRLFFVFKNNFLFLRPKNLFGNSKWVENKNCFQNSICEGNWKQTKCCFQFLIFKSQWKNVFNLMNLFYLMS